MPLVLIHTGIVKYLWQILILYSIQFAYPTYSGSPFSDEIAIMIHHYVIHPYLKIRHYVIHPTKCKKNFKNRSGSPVSTTQSIGCLSIMTPSKMGKTEILIFHSLIEIVYLPVFHSVRETTIFFLGGGN